MWIKPPNLLEYNSFLRWYYLFKLINSQSFLFKYVFFFTSITRNKKMEDKSSFHLREENSTETDPDHHPKINWHPQKIDYVILSNTYNQNHFIHICLFITQNINIMIVPRIKCSYKYEPPFKRIAPNTSPWYYQYSMRFMSVESYCNIKLSYRAD